MWLISIQYINLGVLGKSNTPLQLDLQDTSFPLMETVHKRDLPVILIAGNNGSGKTTLCAGIYFALRGGGTLNGRTIPKGIMTAGAREMSVALTVRNSGQAARFAKHGDYHSDRITLVRTVIVRQDGNDYLYYIVDGCHNLDDPFPYGSKVTAEIYQHVLEAMGVNEGVLHAYEETLEQGSISKLADAAAKDPRQMFDLLCRVIGATNARKDYEINRRKTRDSLLLLQREVQSLKDKKIELERLLRKKDDFERLVDLRTRLSEQKAAQQHAEVQMYVVQKLLYDTRTAILDKQIAEYQAQIEQLRKGSVTLAQRLFQVNTEHGQLKEKQHNAQGELGRAQMLLGQNQAMYQASRQVVDTTPIQAISKSGEEWTTEFDILREASLEALQQFRSMQRDIQEIDTRMQALRGQTSIDRFPFFVKEFSLELTRLGIEHQLLADVLNITNSDWLTAIENYLGNRRFWVMVTGGKKDFDAAYKVVERMRYHPGIRGPKSRPNRSQGQYAGTVWEILDIPIREMEMWSYHLDDLGFQLIAHSAEEARRLNESKPYMNIFTPSGMVSQTDIHARSILMPSGKVVPLYCGKRATELELEQLSRDIESRHQDLKVAQQAYDLAKQKETECAAMKQACADYQAALAKLSSAQEALTHAEEKIDELTRAKAEIDLLVDETRDLMEQLRTESSQSERQIEQINDDISHAQSTKQGSASQLLPTPNVSITKVNEVFQIIEQAIGEPLFTEKRVSRLETQVRDTRILQQTADEEVRVLNLSINEIPDHDSLDETILPKCRALQSIVGSVEQAIAEKRMIFQTNLRAAKSEYGLLQQEMMRATELVQQQANMMSGPLQVDFRIRLMMPDSTFFEMEGDEFSILEHLNALESQTMAVDVKVRFARDIRRDYRGVGDSWASGGQQEIACAALLGGILFAAQQMHAQGEITGADWEKAPLLLLDEPFENLDIVNRRTMIGSLLTLPVQILVLYPMPPLEFIQAADAVITVEKSSGAGNPTLLRLNRGARDITRAEFAAILRGDSTNGMAA